MKEIFHINNLLQLWQTLV